MSSLLPFIFSFVPGPITSGNPFSSLETEGTSTSSAATPFHCNSPPSSSSSVFSTPRPKKKVQQNDTLLVPTATLDSSFPFSSPVTTFNPPTAKSPKSSSRFPTIHPPSGWNDRLRRSVRIKEAVKKASKSNQNSAIGSSSIPRTTAPRCRTFSHKELIITPNNSLSPRSRDVMNCKTRMMSLRSDTFQRRREIRPGNGAIYRPVSVIPPGWTLAVVIDSKSSQTNNNRVHKPYRSTYGEQRCSHNRRASIVASRMQKTEEQPQLQPAESSIGSVIVVQKASPNPRSTIAKQDIWNRPEKLVIDGKHSLLSAESLERMEKWLEAVKPGAEDHDKASAAAPTAYLIQPVSVQKVRGLN